MNPKEALRSAGRAVISPARRFYEWQNRLAESFREDSEHLRAHVRAKYIESMVNVERTIFEMLSESNSVLPQWKRQYFSEDVRRKYNDFFDNQIRAIVDSHRDLHKGSTLHLKDRRGDMRNRILGLESGLAYWQEQLEQPDLPINVIYMGRRRVTQLQEQLDMLSQESSS